MLLLLADKIIMIKTWAQVQENIKELKECHKEHLQIVRKAEE